ncbi:ASKHA domain-containing protein [Desulfolucanica intricata]|uniref:ASKHA domain-containing protein n=1 Tax=Desulfolucanica intricata TaxID=1285191 RepID=UPI00083313D1|nr:ASKHA domain-containing protein [Desulfolucanica intricata]
MPNFTVNFLPDNKKVTISEQENLLQAAAEAGISIKGSCGGAGTCGRCKVIIKEGKFKSARTAKLTEEQLANGYVLSCQTTAESDLVVEIPEESRLSEHQVLLEEATAGETEQLVIDPLYRKIKIELPEPSLTDSTDDLARLEMAVSKATGIKDLRISLNTIRNLPQILRQEQWKVTVSLADVMGYTEIAAVEPGWENNKYYGLAIDIGTTTVVVNLVDLETGDTVAQKGSYNKQAVYGDDIISRIVHATEEKNGMEELRNAVLNTINELIRQLIAENNIEQDSINYAVCAGNTTMVHLFLGIDPKYIRLEPYTPAVNAPEPIRAGEAGLMINEQAWVYCLPGVASYVGGDITSGAHVIGIDKTEKITLFIDVGTNGEMVLGNKDWLMTCACSAGPAFEGGGIKCGMRAMRGAIERLNILPDTLDVEYTTVGGAKAVGICGSGLIDCIAGMRKVGIIDRTGNFSPNLSSPRIRPSDDGPEFILVPKENSGNGQDITISEADIKNLIRSKGAVFAGIRTMLRMMDLPVEIIEEIKIAGGFGRYISLKDAVSIGLFPDIDFEKYKYIGNSSVKGAKLVLLSREARDEAVQLASKMTYLELSIGNDFMDEYVSALFLPHTDLSLFPSLKE